VYIHERADWPRFRWDARRLVRKLAAVRHRQGRLLGRLENAGVTLRDEATLRTLTEEAITSSEIEGAILDREQVRSSLARRLGLESGGLKPADRHTEGVVDMILDATQNCDQPLTRERLCGWQAALFPTGYSGLRRITVGAWRTAASGPMQVVSGAIGRERVHFEAPAAERVEKEMKVFLDWCNSEENSVDPVLRAAQAHLWFETLHPFEDGNGRIGRALVDMLLARSEHSPQRFYSMSTQIRKDQDNYYARLEAAQNSDLDITEYFDWFLECMDNALNGTETVLADVVRKARFWERYAGEIFNERQHKLLNLLLDNFEGHLTTSKWARIAKCSQDTAGRDIDSLVQRNILRKAAAGGRSTWYSLVE